MHEITSTHMTFKKGLVKLGAQLIPVGMSTTLTLNSTNVFSISNFSVLITCLVLKSVLISASFLKSIQNYPTTMNLYTDVPYLWRETLRFIFKYVCDKVV